MRLAPRLNVDDSCDALFLLCSALISTSSAVRWLIRDACLGVLIVCRATCQSQCNTILIIVLPHNRTFVPIYLYAHVVTRSKYGTGEPNHTFASVILFEALSLHSGTTAVHSARKGVMCGSAFLLDKPLDRIKARIDEIFVTFYLIGVPILF